MSALTETWFLREMTQEDLVCVHRLERMTFRKPWSTRQLSGELALSVTSAKVVCEEQQILGYYLASHVAGESSLNRIAVAPNRRGEGLGHRLLEDFLAEAMKRQGQDAFLEVSERNHVAQGLYQAHGFKVVGRRHQYYPEEMADALVMHRKIEREDYADVGH